MVDLVVCQLVVLDEFRELRCILGMDDTYRDDGWIMVAGVPCVVILGRYSVMFDIQ